MVDLGGETVDGVVHRPGNGIGRLASSRASFGSPDRANVVALRVAEGRHHEFGIGDAVPRKLISHGPQLFGSEKREARGGRDGLECKDEGVPAW